MSVRHRDPTLDQLLANLDTARISEEASLLTEERLRVLTGFDDLEYVTEAEFTVDDSSGSIDVIGFAMPAVTDLRLSNSRVSCLRSFGTRLTRLKRLWLNRSTVQDLAGVHFMHQLSELYLAFNGITLLQPLAALLNLEIIDLEGNCIDSISEVEEGLGGLTELKAVTLSGNPFAMRLSSTGKYRRTVLEALSSSSSLELLDDISATQRFDAAQAPDRAELSLLHDALRVTAPGLQQVVEEQHRGLFSRQSSSAAGVRRAATTGQNRGSTATGERRGTTTPRDAGKMGSRGSGGVVDDAAVPSEELSPPDHHRGARSSLNSAPAHLGSPSKGDASTRVSRASAAPTAGGGGGAALPSPPPARHVAQPILASSSLVYSGSITRTLRQSRGVPSRGGAELRQLDSFSTTPTPPTARASLSASTYDTTPVDDGDDIFDDTPEAQEKRRAEAELDRFINDALAKIEDGRIGVEGDQDSQRGTSPSHNDDGGDAGAIDMAEDDESRPAIQAWRERLAKYAAAGASSSAPAAAVAAPLTQADVLHAVISHREGTVKAYQEDLMRDATGGGDGDGYEAIGMNANDGDNDGGSDTL